MKVKQKKTTMPLLSDKIADALTVKPRADIEDDQIFNTKPNTVSRTDYSSESEDEAVISDFRKRTANLLSNISKKYEGKVVSRKELQDSLESSDLSSDEDSPSNELSGKAVKQSDEGSSNTHEVLNVFNKHKTLSNDEGSEDDSSNSDNDYKLNSYSIKNISNNKIGSESDSEENDDYSIVKRQIQGSDESDKEKSDLSGDEEEEEEEEGGYDISQMEEPLKEEFEHVKKQNVSEEAKKGACVRNQLLIWESLLEMRIHLQRCMNSANMMPMADKYGELKSNPDFEEESSVTVNNVAAVLDKFLTLQDLLLKNFPETKKISSNKSQIDVKANAKQDSDEEIPSDTDNEEIPSDTEPEDNVEENKNISDKIIKSKPLLKKRKLEDYESDLSTSHKNLKMFRDAIIQKWNEKTRLTTAANIKNTPTNTILQQISYILSDRNKLIRRTQLKRSDYDIIGYKKPDFECNEENNIGQNGMTRDRKDNDEYIPEIFDDSDFYHQLLRELIECKSADISDPVQLSRQWIALQQMRSKMKRKVDTRATKGRKIKYVVHNPLVSYMAPEKSLKWNEESTNELYSSLFGKMFENNNVGVNVNLENDKMK